MSFGRELVDLTMTSYINPLGLNVFMCNTGVTCIFTFAKRTYLQCAWHTAGILWSRNCFSLWLLSISAQSRASYTNSKYEMWSTIMVSVMDRLQRPSSVRCIPLYKERSVTCNQHDAVWNTFKIWLREYLAFCLITNRSAAKLILMFAMIAFRIL